MPGSSRAIAASPLVRAEWSRRIAAEYGSAAITQHFTLWLIQIGAAPDLIADGLRVVADELAHSEMSHDVHVAAGGNTPPQLDRDTLGLARNAARPLEHDVLLAAVQVYCLGETVAVPLFRHLRERCEVPVARKALDRVLRDEVRHRDFGWSVLDWFLQSPLAAEVPTVVVAALPRMFGQLELNYGGAPLAGEAAAAASAAFPEADRAWGLAPPHEYAAILGRTYDRDYVPRFRDRGIDPEAAWAGRLGATTP
jgi:hypothetical protein